MKKLYYIFILIFCFYIGWYFIKSNNRVCAFLRVKDEIKTIEACLNSIDGIFDKIIIIHSNEKDDGSVVFMQQWCSKRNYCEIHEYPYRVIPSHSKEYKKGHFNKENTLASYYNFGLKFFKNEDWVIKIDGDQVYLRERLNNFIKPFKNGKMDDSKYYGLSGYNSFVKNNEIVLFSNHPINGGKDSFIVKRKNIKNFIQEKYYEVVDIDVPFSHVSEPVWFHFMKSLKIDGNVKSNENASSDEILYLSQEEKELFEKNIRPLLKNSPYYKIKVPIKK